MSLKLVINGCPLEIFEGAIVGDAVRKFSSEVYKDVKHGRADVEDLNGNKYYLSGELTGDEVFRIEKKLPPEKKMTKSKHILIFTIILALSILILSTLLNGDESRVTKITIFHLNDIHGDIDNMGKITHIVESERAKNPNVFLVQAGDNFSGNPVVDQYDPKGEPLLILMNKMKFSAGTIGNHDFDYGKKILKSFIERADFPMLCSNIKSNDPDFPQPVPYTVLKTEDGIELVILGLIQTEAHSGIPSTLPDNVKGLKFFKGTEFALKYKHLKKDNNVFIALSHLGFLKDKVLAGKMGELDLIIGGHSHTLIDNPALENGVLIAQAGAHADYLGRIDIILKDGKIIERKGSVINIDNAKASNREVEELIESFNNKGSLNKVLAVINTPIRGRHDLGLMVTDAIREDLGFDMIFYNKGGIRINRLSGKIRTKDIYTMHPFGNYIVEMRMDTSEIKDLIKNDYEQSRGIDIIPSGLSYRVIRDLNKKVLDVELFDLNGYRIQEGRTFQVGMNNYIVSSYKFRHKDPGRSTNAKTVDIMLRFFTGLDRKLHYSNVVRSDERIVYTGKVETLGITEIDIYTAKKKFYRNSPSGNMVADAMRTHTGSDIALFPTRLLRSDLTITKGEKVYKEALPDLYNFLSQSKVVVVSMDRKQLEMFILKRAGNKNNIDLHISGGSYTILLNKNNKVEGIGLEPDGGSMLNQTHEFKVALIEYEFNNFYSLKKQIKNFKVAPDGLDSILAEYIRKLGKVPLKTGEKRVTLNRKK